MIFFYRPEIDGLRAIAIISVIFYHAGLGLFINGYFGVDIFFVISGYLITSIIIKDLNNKTFSFKNFYERRARRILPALIFTILISSLISYFLLTTNEILNYFKSVNSTLLFYSNFFFWKATPYFASEAELEPLLHTWSLSIEEQFYIFFPLTLIFFSRFFKKKIIFFYFFIFLSSFSFCQILSLKTLGNFNFYFTYSRIWEITLGCIASHFIYNKKLLFSKKIENFFSIIGLILIFTSIFFLDSKISHPSLFTLLPTVGTFLIIIFANKLTIVKKILSQKILVSLGLVSYSLYLFHQPLLSYTKIIFDKPSVELKFLILFISLILSVFSYKFIEKIFRNKKKVNQKNFILFSLFSVFFLLCFSTVNIYFFSKKQTEKILAEKLINNDAIFSTKIDERNFIKQRILIENLKPKILIIGSSRFMEISSSDFDQNALNLSVSGASIEDQISITEMALEKFNPDKIFLSADPWLFNKNNNQTRWKSLIFEYSNTIKNIKKMKKENTILFNRDSTKNFNFMDRILNDFYNLANVRKLSLTDYNSEIHSLDRDIILRDGRRVYGNLRKKKKWNTEILNYSMNNYVFSIELFNTYKNFIKYVKKVHKKKVILILVPYYYPSYLLTNEHNSNYINVEKKFNDLGKELEIQILGSYNSLVSSCDKKDFHDNIHPKNSCLKKILNHNKN